MKQYYSVIKKMEEDNYKLGVYRRTDLSGGYYKVNRTFYFLSLIWFGVFHMLYLFSNTVVRISSPRAAEQIDETLYLVSWVTFVALLIGLVATLKKFHLVAFPLNTIVCILQMRTLYLNDDVNTYGFLEKGLLSNKYFWFHFVPAGLIILFSAVLFGFSLVSFINFKKDYNRSLSSMYNNYLEQNPNVSDAEWQEQLSSLDSAMTKENTKGLKRWLF